VFSVRGWSLDRGGRKLCGDSNGFSRGIETGYVRCSLGPKLLCVDRNSKRRRISIKASPRVLAAVTRFQCCVCSDNSSLPKALSPRGLSAMGKLSRWACLRGPVCLVIAGVLSVPRETFSGRLPNAPFRCRFLGKLFPVPSHLPN